MAFEEEISQRKSEGASDFSQLNSSVLDQSHVQDMKKREGKLQKVLESYETTFHQQAEDLENYKAKIKILEEKAMY